MPQLKERLRRGLRNWASSDSLEARELQDDTVRAGCCPVAEAGDRAWVKLQGSLRTVTLVPRGGVPALEADLYDGSGSIRLVWLGRRRIAGIEPGRSIRVEGRIGVQEDGRVIYNPRYQLRT